MYAASLCLQDEFVVVVVVVVFAWPFVRHYVRAHSTMNTILADASPWLSQIAPCPAKPTS
jgi:hypothetical protein